MNDEIRSPTGEGKIKHIIEVLSTKESEDLMSKLPEDTLCCKSCGKQWIEHLGAQGLCVEIAKLKARINELEEGDGRARRLFQELTPCVVQDKPVFVINQIENYIAGLKAENLKLTADCAEKDKALKWIGEVATSLFNDEYMKDAVRDQYVGIIRHVQEARSLDCGKSIMEEVERWKKESIAASSNNIDHLHEIDDIKAALKQACESLTEICRTAFGPIKPNYARVNILNIGEKSIAECKAVLDGK